MKRIISGKNVSISMEDDNLEIIQLSSDLEKYLVENPVFGRSDYTDLPGVKEDVRSPWRQFSYLPRRTAMQNRRYGQQRELSEEARRKREEAKERRLIKIASTQRKKEESVLRRATKRKLQDHLLDNEYLSQHDKFQNENKGDSDSPNLIISSPKSKRFLWSSPVSKATKANRNIFKAFDKDKSVKSNGAKANDRSPGDKDSDSDICSDGQTESMSESESSKRTPLKTMLIKSSESSSAEKNTNSETWSIKSNMEGEAEDQVMSPPKRTRKQERKRYSEIDEPEEDNFYFVPPSSTKSGRIITPVSRILEDAIVSASMVKTKRKETVSKEINEAGTVEIGQEKIPSAPNKSVSVPSTASETHNTENKLSNFGSIAHSKSSVISGAKVTSDISKPSTCPTQNKKLIDSTDSKETPKTTGAKVTSDTSKPSTCPTQNKKLIDSTDSKETPKTTASSAIPNAFSPTFINSSLIPNVLSHPLPTAPLPPPFTLLHQPRVNLNHDLPTYLIEQPTSLMPPPLHLMPHRPIYPSTHNFLSAPTSIPSSSSSTSSNLIQPFSTSSQLLPQTSVIQSTTNQQCKPPPNLLSVNNAATTSNDMTYLKGSSLSQSHHFQTSFHPGNPISSHHNLSITPVLQSSHPQLPNPSLLPTYINPILSHPPLSNTSVMHPYLNPPPHPQLFNNTFIPAYPSQTVPHFRPPQIALLSPGISNSTSSHSLTTHASNTGPPSSRLNLPHPQPLTRNTYIPSSSGSSNNSLQQLSGPPLNHFPTSFIPTTVTTSFSNPSISAIPSSNYNNPNWMKVSNTYPVFTHSSPFGSESDPSQNMGSESKPSQNKGSKGGSKGLKYDQSSQHSVPPQIMNGTIPTGAYNNVAVSNSNATSVLKKVVVSLDDTNHTFTRVLNRPGQESLVPKPSHNVSNKIPVGGYPSSANEKTSSSMGNLESSRTTQDGSGKTVKSCKRTSLQEVEDMLSSVNKVASKDKVASDRTEGTVQIPSTKATGINRSSKEQSVSAVEEMLDNISKAYNDKLNKKSVSQNKNTAGHVDTSSNSNRDVEKRRTSHNDATNPPANDTSSSRTKTTGQNPSDIIPKSSSSRVQPNTLQPNTLHYYNNPHPQMLPNFPPYPVDSFLMRQPSPHVAHHNITNNPERWFNHSHMQPPQAHMNAPIAHLTGHANLRPPDPRSHSKSSEVLLRPVPPNFLHRMVPPPTTQHSHNSPTSVRKDLPSHNTENQQRHYHQQQPKPQTTQKSQHNLPHPQEAHNIPQIPHQQQQPRVQKGQHNLPRPQAHIPQPPPPHGPSNSMTYQQQPQHGVSNHAQQLHSQRNVNVTHQQPPPIQGQTSVLPEQRLPISAFAQFNLRPTTNVTSCINSNPAVLSRQNTSSDSYMIHKNAPNSSQLSKSSSQNNGQRGQENPSANLSVPSLPLGDPRKSQILTQPSPAMVSSSASLESRVIDKSVPSLTQPPGSLASMLPSHLTNITRTESLPTTANPDRSNGHQMASHPPGTICPSMGPLQNVNPISRNQHISETSNESPTSLRDSKVDVFRKVKQFHSEGHGEDGDEEEDEMAEEEVTTNKPRSETSNELPKSQQDSKADIFLKIKQFQADRRGEEENDEEEDEMAEEEVTTNKPRSETSNELPKSQQDSKADIFLKIKQFQADRRGEEENDEEEDEMAEEEVTTNKPRSETSNELPKSQQDSKADIFLKIKQFQADRRGEEENDEEEEMTEEEVTTNKPRLETSNELPKSQKDSKADIFRKIKRSDSYEYGEGDYDEEEEMEDEDDSMSTENDYQRDMKPVISDLLKNQKNFDNIVDKNVTTRPDSISTRAISSVNNVAGTTAPSVVVSVTSSILSSSTPTLTTASIISTLSISTQSVMSSTALLSSMSTLAPTTVSSSITTPALTSPATTSSFPGSSSNTQQQSGNVSITLGQSLSLLQLINIKQELSAKEYEEEEEEEEEETDETEEQFIEIEVTNMPTADLAQASNISLSVQAPFSQSCTSDAAICSQNRTLSSSKSLSTSSLIPPTSPQHLINIRNIKSEPGSMLKVTGPLQVCPDQSTVIKKLIQSFAELKKKKFNLGASSSDAQNDLTSSLSKDSTINDTTQYSITANRPLFREENESCSRHPIYGNSNSSKVAHVKELLQSLSSVLPQKNYKEAADQENRSANQEEIGADQEEVHQEINKFHHQSEANRSEQHQSVINIMLPTPLSSTSVPLNGEKANLSVFSERNETPSSIENKAVRNNIQMTDVTSCRIEHDLTKTDGKSNKVPPSRQEDQSNDSTSKSATEPSSGIENEPRETDGKSSNETPVIDDELMENDGKIIIVIPKTVIGPKESSGKFASVKPCANADNESIEKDSKLVTVIPRTEDEPMENDGQLTIVTPRSENDGNLTIVTPRTEDEPMENYGNLVTVTPRTEDEPMENYGKLTIVTSRTEDEPMENDSKLVSPTPRTEDEPMEKDRKLNIVTPRTENDGNLTVVTPRTENEAMENDGYLVIVMPKTVNETMENDNKLVVIVNETPATKENQPVTMENDNVTPTATESQLQLVTMDNDNLTPTATESQTVTMGNDNVTPTATESQTVTMEYDNVTPTATESQTVTMENDNLTPTATESQTVTMENDNVTPTATESQPITMENDNAIPAATESQTVTMEIDNVTPTATESRLVTMENDNVTPAATESQPVTMENDNVTPTATESQTVTMENDNVTPTATESQTVTMENDNVTPTATESQTVTMENDNVTPTATESQTVIVENDNLTPTATESQTVIVENDNLTPTATESQTVTMENDNVTPTATESQTVTMAESQTVTMENDNVTPTATESLPVTMENDNVTPKATESQTVTMAESQTVTMENDNVTPTATESRLVTMENDNVTPTATESLPVTMENDNVTPTTTESQPVIMENDNVTPKATESLPVIMENDNVTPTATESQTVIMEPTATESRPVIMENDNVTPTATESQTVTMENDNVTTTATESQTVTMENDNVTPTTTESRLVIMENDDVTPTTREIQTVTMENDNVTPTATESQTVTMENDDVTPKTTESQTVTMENDDVTPKTTESQTVTMDNDDQAANVPATTEYRPVSIETYSNLSTLSKLIPNVQENGNLEGSIKISSNITPTVEMEPENNGSKPSNLAGNVALLSEKSNIVAPSFQTFTIDERPAVSSSGMRKTGELMEIAKTSVDTIIRNGPLLSENSDVAACINQPTSTVDESPVVSCAVGKTAGKVETIQKSADTQSLNANTISNCDIVIDSLNLGENSPNLIESGEIIIESDSDSDIEIIEDTADQRAKFSVPVKKDNTGTMIKIDADIEMIVGEDSTTKSSTSFSTKETPVNPQVQTADEVCSNKEMNKDRPCPGNTTTTSLTSLHVDTDIEIIDVQGFEESSVIKSNKETKSVEETVEILSSDDEEERGSVASKQATCSTTSTELLSTSRLHRMFSTSDDGVSSRSSNSPLSSPSGSRGVVSKCIQALGKWSKEQVSEWLGKNKLEKICLNLSNLDGQGLQRMAFEYHRDPEVFYGRVKKSLGLSMFQTLVIGRSLKALIQSLATDV